MAIKDKLQILVDNEDISSSITSDIIKLAAAGTNPGVANEGQYLNVELDATIVAAGAATVTVTLNSSATVGGSYVAANPAIIITLTKGTDAAGDILSFKLPRSLLQFVKAVVATTGSPSAGEVSVWIGQREDPRG